jgi:putative transposase
MPEPRASVRAKSDADLCVKIDAAWQNDRKLYGARKVWHGLLRDNEELARFTVERLMRRLGLKGLFRGKRLSQPIRAPRSRAPTTR